MAGQLGARLLLFVVVIVVVGCRCCCRRCCWCCARLSARWRFLPFFFWRGLKLCQRCESNKWPISIYCCCRGCLFRFVCERRNSGKDTKAPENIGKIDFFRPRKSKPFGVITVLMTGFYFCSTLQYFSELKCMELTLVVFGSLTWILPLSQQLAYPLFA